MKYGIIQNIKFLYKQVWSYNRKIVGYQVLEVIFSTLAPVVLVFIPAYILKLLETSQSFNHLILSCIFLFILYSPISACKTYFSDRNSMQYIEFRNKSIQNDYLMKQFHIPYAIWESEKFQNEYFKGLLSICNNDEGVEDFLHHLPILATEILSLIIFCILLSSLNPLLILFLLIFSFVQILFFIPASNYQNKIRGTQLAKLEKTNEYFKKLKSNSNSAKDIRIFGLQHWLLDKYKKYSVEHDTWTKKIMHKFFIHDLVGCLIQLIRDLICYGYLIFELFRGLDPSLFILYIGVITGISTWFDKITTSFSRLYKDNKMINDFRTIIDYPETDEISGEPLKNKEPFTIKFNHVSFSYPDTEQLILDDISFTINSNENIALVGVNGAGKSTIVKLLCGFYKPTSGTITINSQDLSSLNLDEYLDMCSCIFQETNTLAFTVKENITCVSDEFVDNEKLKTVIHLADLKEKIDALPNREYTYLEKHLDSNGVSISGGEFQKIMLARSLYKNGCLYLLDEPTAALDAITENKIYEQYKMLTQHATSLFISHRLSSTKFCNRILVLDHGKIIEEGTHKELLDKNGFYAQLFNIQSQYYQEGCDENEIQTSVY